MKFVKVLDKNLCPPIQGGAPYEIGVWHHCENFNTSNVECAPGFYVIPVSELIHYHKPWKGTKVLPAEVKGNSKIFSALKQRHEYMRLSNPLSDEKIKKLCSEIETELGYKLFEALYPVNPLLLPKATVTKADIELLRQWYSVEDSVRHSVWDSVEGSAWYSVCDSVSGSVWDNIRHSVRDSVRHSVWHSIEGSAWYSVSDSVRENVWNSVWNYVWDSIRYSVWDSIRHSIRYSVWDSIRNNFWAYVGNLFPLISNWKYIDHEPNVYPFQAVVDLWYRGLLPVYDGIKWMFLSGEKAEIVWTEPEVGWLKSQMEES